MNKTVVIVIIVVIILIIAVIVGVAFATAQVDPCSSYKDTDVNLNDKCIENLWKKGGCPMPGIGQKNYYKASKATMTKFQIANDAKAWATLPDDDHRISCYGDDRKKWPAATKG